MWTAVYGGAGVRALIENEGFKSIEHCVQGGLYQLAGVDGSEEWIQPEEIKRAACPFPFNTLPVTYQYIKASMV